MEKKYTLEEVILMFEKKISKNNFIDSVHKIKMMTTIEMLRKLKLEL
tara:strand:+ start:6453 stop:6593 length:141 start_codon:yes stop_codon:yes gene_type:complete